jgi:molybdopterin-biosynthesis enzyme MoeA-like protein
MVFFGPSGIFQLFTRFFNPSVNDSSMHDTFGLIIIGDELLLGAREDRHFAYFQQMLSQRNQRLHRCWLLPDDETSLITHLKLSMREMLPVFVCGGIGATPDDLTRNCAAVAAGVTLEPHPEAVALIEARFGEKAYPTRIQMAVLPKGAELIPNPYNRIPGFTINKHYFLPGFPEMAWPMAQWVVDHFYPSPEETLTQRSVEIIDTPESRLVAIMESLKQRFPEVKLYSLPTLGDNSYIELGVRGRGDITAAFTALLEILRADHIPFR